MYATLSFIWPKDAEALMVNILNCCNRVTSHFPRGASQNTISEDIDIHFTCTCPYRLDFIMNKLEETGSRLTRTSQSLHLMLI